VNEHEDVEPPVLVPVPVPVFVGVPPVSDALTFAMVLLSAPNEVRSERIDETCASVNAAACAIGARESIDVAIASPVATAATFAIALVVTFCITVFNEFKKHVINQV
jgi:mannose/fructose/N-acetylgalactosamine-specific phosphotransferase system component IIC